MEEKLNYRPDIDGLRAVSVLAVVAFHLKIGLHGGFTGVDVFFVISGFLIGQIVYSEVGNGSFSLLRFYERRARRILPALLVTIAASWLIASRLLYDFELADFSKSGIASILFVANLYFFQTSGYFAPAAETIPLLHLWSLGIEEQFYLLFPPAVMLLAKYAPRTTLTALFLTGVLSLAISQLLLSSHPDAAFYLPISRAFELLIGALLAHPKFPRARRHITSEYAAALGAAGLAAAILFYGPQTAFPGVAALLPCGSAALILWSNQLNNTRVARLLGWFPLIYIGKRSYSLYLVHWPAIVFGKLLLPNLPYWLFAMAVAAASFALADMSFRYVENPLRHGAFTRRHPIRLALAAMLAAGLLPTWTLLKLRAPASTDPLVNAVLSFNLYNPRTRFLARECFLDAEQGFEDFALTKCIPSTADQAVILWGDSHAAHLYFGLRSELQKRGVAVGMVAASGCVPIMDLDVVERPKCRAVNDRALPFLLALKPRLIVLSAAWRMNDDALTKLKLTVNRLIERGIDVAVVGESPSFRMRAPNIAAAKLQSHRAAIAEDPDVDIASMELFDRMLATAFDGAPMITYFSPYRVFCPEKRCPLLTGEGDPIYFDFSHLTEAGSLLYAKQLMNKLPFTE